MNRLLLLLGFYCAAVDEIFADEEDFFVTGSAVFNEKFWQIRKNFLLTRGLLLTKFPLMKETRCLTKNAVFGKKFWRLKKTSSVNTQIFFSKKISSALHAVAVTDEILLMKKNAFVTKNSVFTNKIFSDKETC